MATISVLLTDGRWVRQGPLSVCGHVYKGRLRDAAALCRCFAGVGSSAEFEDVLRKVNGFFAVVCETRNGLLAAVDRIRSIPLFFRSQTSSLCVTNRATTLVESGQPIRPRSIARAEFRLTGFVSGQETLSPNIRQI